MRLLLLVSWLKGGLRILLRFLASRLSAKSKVPPSKPRTVLIVTIISLVIPWLKLRLIGTLGLVVGLLRFRKVSRYSLALNVGLLLVVVTKGILGVKVLMPSFLVDRLPCGSNCMALRMVPLFWMLGMSRLKLPTRVLVRLFVKKSALNLMLKDMIGCRSLSNGPNPAVPPMLIGIFLPALSVVCFIMILPVSVLVVVLLVRFLIELVSGGNLLLAIPVFASHFAMLGNVLSLKLIVGSVRNS